MKNDTIALDNITLIGIDGIGDEGKTLKALKYSSKNIIFKNIKLLTCDNIKEDFIEIIKINKMTYEDYAVFCLKYLKEYVDTDYVMIIHNDGFILNPKLWDNNFLKYDYLGAPWSIHNISYVISRDPFLVEANNKNKQLYRVGNGGFSLRSKKLIEKTSDLYKEEYRRLPEDVVIGIVMRETLENEYGIKFPELSIAKIFSCEEQNLGDENISISNSFGFHGKAYYSNLINELLNDQ